MSQNFVKKKPYINFNVVIAKAYDKEVERPTANMLVGLIIGVYFLVCYLTNGIQDILDSAAKVSVNSTTTTTTTSSSTITTTGTTKTTVKLFKPIKTETDAAIYLAKLGYVDEEIDEDAVLTDKEKKEKMTKAIKKYQEFFGLEGLSPTGKLDDKTIEIMNKPRCGNGDYSVKKHRRQKRYAHHESYWLVPQNRHVQLSYNISNYPTATNMNPEDVDFEIQRAFELWSRYLKVFTFKRLSNEVSPNFHIKWASGDHGDGEPFDGPEGNLAHGFYPAFGGDIHFDDDEHWTMNSTEGKNLFGQALHEIGHTLGLMHSNVSEMSAMYPIERSFPKFSRQMEGLDNDDATGVGTLYNGSSQELEENECFFTTRGRWPYCLFPFELEDVWADFAGDEYSINDDDHPTHDEYDAWDDPFFDD